MPFEGPAALDSIRMAFLSRIFSRAVDSAFFSLAALIRGSPMINWDKILHSLHNHPQHSFSVVPLPV